MMYSPHSAGLTRPIPSLTVWVESTYIVLSPIAGIFVCYSVFLTLVKAVVRRL
ncbi:hypothetical protein BJV74DRAFT_828683 [Russula compacta]|nr:hypothetical protein BJV74DRAFT_828683 [Russula compacta]